MNRRLMFSGYPCPPAPWKAYLPADCEQRIVPFSESLRMVGKPDFRALGRHAAGIIRQFQPTSIVCHDYGVICTLLALLHLKKKKEMPSARLTLFNGAFRGFDVFRAPHPVKLQFAPVSLVEEKMRKAGGEMDPAFRELQPIVRGLYRRVILLSIADKITGLVKKRKPMGIRLGIPGQIIASPGDPFIPIEFVERMREDFGIEEYHEIPYGHFPYLANQEASRKLLLAWESRDDEVSGGI